MNAYDMNYVDDILYVPHLDTSPLSVRQFLLKGYSIVFEDETCHVFKEKSKKQLQLQVLMTKNKIFFFGS